MKPARLLPFFLFTFFLFCLHPIAAQDDHPLLPPLPEQQRSIAERFGQWEQILLRMSEATTTSNPRRAELLKKTLLASKDKLLALQLHSIVDVLERRSLTEAITHQETAEKELLALLRMLESENREQRREQEKERIKEFLRDLEEIIQREKILRTRTVQQDGNILPDREKEQRDVRLQTQSLQDRMSTELEPEDSPTQQAMQKAADRMKMAEEKLQKAETEGVLEDQEEAIAELQKAKAELEKILRQIREKELLQTLEKLEERMKRMIRIEQSIRSKTENSESARRPIRLQANQLAADQWAVIADTDAALVLLREDGTARAMVESLLQTRFDMDDIRRRLEQTKLDTTTVGIQDAVVAALQEMLDAIELAIEEAEKRKDRSSPPDDSPDVAMDEEPLIQLLSELKMIRSMQQRVNERTQRCEIEIEMRLKEPDADLTSLRKQVEELARQQNRISRILHDLKMGKTE